MVVDCGHAKVLDLSVARPPGPAPAGVGTFCYLAPAQARGGPLTAAADVAWTPSDRPTVTELAASLGATLPGNGPHTPAAENPRTEDVATLRRPS